MECHPQYNPETYCNQRDIDIAMGRDWTTNPYMNEDWYQGEEDTDLWEMMDDMIMSGATGVFTSAATILAVSLATLA